MNTTIGQRTAGVLVPLFSLRGEGGWGVGEFPDAGAFAPWLAAARAPILMMCPLLEAALGQDSPYAAISAFALDPLYLRMDLVEDFAELGGEACLDDEERRTLEHVRGLAAIEYGAVRWLKSRVLRRCFARFCESGAAAGDRGKDLAAFRQEHASWLPDYVLFRALKEHRPDGSWREWDLGVREHVPEALASARERHREDVARFEYLQWLAFRQLAAARKEARRHGVRLAGDLPFLVAEDSADVWARQREFRFDATVGVPPDAFSADGQDWGLPVYRWDVIEPGGYEWQRQRGKRAAVLFDLVRIDHVVGFYRTYARPRDGSPHFFLPPDEPSQRSQGEAVMKAFRAGGVEVVAEDLGTIPPFVRESLTSIGVPGYRVLRWEKDEERYRDPASWPALSLATTGTHDNEPLAPWWDELPEAERRAIRELPALRGLSDDAAKRFCPEVHQALLEAVYGSGSGLLVLPVQDVFGARERINLPGTVGAHNWTYRLPWKLEAMAVEPEVRRAQERLAALASRFSRAS